MRIIAFDTETHPIGVDAVAPRMICVSIAERNDRGKIESTVLSRVDDDCAETVWELLQLGHLLVGQNVAFDLSVFCTTYPQLRSAVFAKIRAGEVTDIMLREQLLNLSTVGKLEMMPLPNGQTKRIGYSLADMVLSYLGLDISEEKHDSDAPRKNYDKLDGLRAAQYPAQYYEYAAKDAEYPLQIYELQQARVQSETGYASLATDRFQTRTAFALYRITVNGMEVDPAEFRKFQEFVLGEMGDDKMGPLFDAGILNRAVTMPHSKHVGKAADMLAEWLGIAPEDVDWPRVDAGLLQALQDCGVKLKKAQPTSKNMGQLKRRVMMATLRRAAVAFNPDATLEDLVDLADELNIPYKKTDTGAVGTDGDTYGQLVDYDPALACFKHRQNLDGLLTRELPRMCWPPGSGQPAKTVHFNYKTLVETSRTSSYASSLYPSANGQNVDPRARKVFRARPGYVLCSTDFSTLELVCVAQTTYELFGHSVHRDLINQGYDLHAYLGAVLYRYLGGFTGGYEEFKALEGTPEYALWRKFAKPVGLGFASGLGPYTLLGHAIGDPYNIDICQVAEERFKTHPEEFEEPAGAVLFHAQRLFSMSEGGFEWNRVLKGTQLAAHIRERVWLETYPEMRDYFGWIKSQRDENNPTLISQDPDGEEKHSDGYCYTTPLGMHRAAASYTAAVNGRALQSPGAEGFKTVCWDLVAACEDPAVGSILLNTGRVVNEIHDETLTELLEDDLLHERAMEVKRIHEEGMARVLRDVKITAEPCLMRRWDKAAKAVWKDGRLQVWEPKA